MIGALCIDDDGGMIFNGRRQSRDSAVTEDLAKEAGDGPVHMEEYSAKLFEGRKISVSPSFLDDAGEGDLCFIEKKSPAAYEDRMEKLIVYRWNRRYPADMRMDIDTGKGWKLISSCDIKGNSHDRITKEVYTK